MFASVGFATVLGLVVLLRELGVACHGNEIVYILGVGCWLLAAASGSAWRRAPGPGLPATIFFLAVTIPGGLVLARGLRPLFAIPPAADLSIAVVMVMAALLLLPHGYLSGRLHRLASDDDIERRRRDLAACLGGSAGGLAAGLLVALGLPALIGALLASLMLAATLMGRGGRWRQPAWTLIGTAALVAVVAGPLDRWLTGWSHPGDLHTLETPHGRLGLVVAEDRLTLWRDHLPVTTVAPSRHAGFAAPQTGAWELVHLAASQLADPGEVLLLGGWLEGLPGAIARHGQPSIVCLEPDRRAIDLATRFLADPAPTGDPLASVTLIHADPRRWLDATSARFDLIVSALPGPVTARDSRYWTLEFLRSCARNLQQDGVLALRLPTDHEVWSARETRRLAAVHRTLTEVFSDVQVLPGAVTLLLAANRPLERDLEVLAARLQDAGAMTAPVADRPLAEWLAERWRGDHTQQTTALLASAIVPPNTDLRPTCFADSLLAELGRFIPGLGWREIPRPSRWLAPAIAGGVVLVIALRRRLGAAATLVMGYAGLASVIVAGVLVLDHQIQHGTLYRDLGPLLALVALGAAAGIWLGGTWPLRRTGRTTDGRWRLPLLHVLMSVWSFLVTLGLLLGQHPLAPLLWLLGTGLLAAMIGATVARLGDLHPGRRRAAALTGGGLGALLAAILLLPFSGLPATALTVAVLAFPAALSIWPLPGQSLESP